MNLYDEAIEEAIWHGEIEGPQTVVTISKALERAKKVEKLLDLYRLQREDKKINSLSSTTLYWDLQRQIDEKEKELGETK